MPATSLDSISLSTPTTTQPGQRRRNWLGVPLLALFTATAARAQMGGGKSGGHRPSGEPPPAGSACATQPNQLPTLMQVQFFIEDRLNTLPNELVLSTDAQPAFERYARAVKQLVDDEVKRSLKAPKPDTPALQAINQEISDANNRAAAWDEVLDAVKTLNTQLTAPQQAIANRRLVVSIDPRHWMNRAS